MPEPPGIDVLIAWLEGSVGLHATDAFRCAQPLFVDGCRCIEDVRLLAEDDDLSGEIPKVMRKKIHRTALQPMPPETCEL